MPNTHRRKTKKGLNVSTQYAVLFVANKLHRCAEAIKAPTHKTHTGQPTNRQPTTDTGGGKRVREGREKKKMDDQVESGWRSSNERRKEGSDGGSKGGKKQ